MEFKEIAKKVKKAERVRIWIGDPDQPAYGEWITPTKEMIENFEDNQRRIEQGPTLIEYDDKIAYNDHRLGILYKLQRLE